MAYEYMYTYKHKRVVHGIISNITRHVSYTAYPFLYICVKINSFRPL